MSRHIDVAIIGAGQAGLSMSQVLGRAGLEHIVFERGRIGERWHSERWPGLKLLTPNWMMRLPGFGPNTEAPQDFMPAVRFGGLLSRYAAQWSMPVVDETEVLAVRPAWSGYSVATTSGTWFARAVVMATGACDRPKVPAWASDLPPDILQVTPDRYAGPGEMPAGGVLVVGASATGVQLAEEIHLSGRDVTLAVGRHVRTPRRYRGRDIYEWLDACGFLGDAPRGDPVRLRNQPSFQLVGSCTGRNVSLAQLSAIGVNLTGRARNGDGGRIHFDPDLEAQCAAAEKRLGKVLVRIDDFIAEKGISAPRDDFARLAPSPLSPSPETLDLQDRNVRSIVWATGYRREYPWLKVPVCDADGEIIHCGGVTSAPGLFLLGMPFMRRRSSAFIDGVGRDAEALSRRIIQYINSQPARVAA
ncbi:MAG: NAD(P)/FAD-dependent oxidoreductase [Hyphomonas sp.]|nr:NAD(P)/FAD-dependent oxidoreductase [Hyphomonas sp.]